MPAPELTDARRNELRALFGRFATGVVVVTAKHDEDHLAVTMNSFSTVSLDPPLISICLGAHLKSRSAFQQAEHFCISILGAGQEDVSGHCARPGGKDWAEIPHATARTGVRYLDPALAVLECDRHTVFEAGDHSILIGRVRSWQTGSLSRPLLFFNSGYSQIA